MKQAAVCLIVLVAVQCLALTRAQNFTCEETPTKFVPKRTDVVVERTTLTQDLEDGDYVERIQEVFVPIDHGFAPRAGDHDLELGDCQGADIYDMYNFTQCNYPGTGNTTQYINVRFNGHVEIYCIRILDTYVNPEGEDLGGYPFVDDGGVGFDTVEMRLVSQEGQGMKFLIEIYTSVLENTLPVTTPSTLVDQF